MSGADELKRNAAAQQLSEAIKNRGMELSEIQHIASHKNDFPFDLLATKAGDPVCNVTTGTDNGAGKISGGIQSSLYDVLSNSKHFGSLFLCLSCSR